MAIFEILIVLFVLHISPFFYSKKIARHNFLNSGIFLSRNRRFSVL